MKNPVTTSRILATTEAAKRISSSLAMGGCFWKNALFDTKIISQLSKPTGATMISKDESIFGKGFCGS
jgi:hypothetical protein